MTDQPVSPNPVDPQKAALNKQLETTAWGLFLVMLGVTLFFKDLLPDGLTSIGVGLIMLGLNTARYFNKIRMSGFTTVLGVLSVIGGVVQLLGVKNLEGAFLLIILGAFLLLKPWFDQHKLFGKAEQS
jgi:hypothetical protein